MTAPNHLLIHIAIPGQSSYQMKLDNDAYTIGPRPGK